MEGEGGMPKQIGSEIGKNLSNLKSSLKEFAGQIKVKRERELEIAQKKADERIKTETKYDNWLKKLRPKAEKSARVIFSWIGDLLKSEEWKEFMVEYQDIIKSISISEDITYKDEITHQFEGNKSFDLSFDGDLWVHHNVKYGKSYEIRDVEDMMQKVDFPVIIKMADTIKNQSIWLIIARENKENFKRRLG